MKSALRSTRAIVKPAGTSDPRVGPARRAVLVAALWTACALPAAARGSGAAGPVAVAARGAVVPDPAALRHRFVLLVSPDGAIRLPRQRIEFGAIETDRCLKCHGIPNFMVRDSATLAIRCLSVDAPAFRGSVHGKLACTQCHGDVRAHPHEFKTRRAKVGCDADCHARDPKGQPIRHEAQIADFRKGAHRRGLTGENPDSPGCTYCHGAGDPHLAARAKKALGPRQKMALCGPCHDDRERMVRDRVNPDAVASYRRSFHYKAIRFGSTRTAVCQDCHAVHRVLSPRDTASTVSAAHLPRTCGQENCHRGARLPFAMSGANHLDLRVRREPALAAVETFFVRLGAITLLVLGAGVVLDAQRRIFPANPGRWIRRRPVRAALAPEGADGARSDPKDSPSPANVEPLVPRLSLAQRIQHGALVLSFLALAVTGIPLRFPDSRPLAWLYQAAGGLAVARTIHRAAAVVMILVALAHIVYVLALLGRGRPGFREAWTMLPARRDARDWWGASMYYLRRRASPPACDRHHFREKVHYFAVLWGVPVMAFSGLVLWFPVFFGNRLPDLAIGMAYIAHSDEALLAVAIVVLWHLYVVHLSPGAHLRFMTWIDGRITREEWLAQHRLEAERTAGVLGARGPAERSDW